MMRDVNGKGQRPSAAGHRLVTQAGLGPYIVYFVDTAKASVVSD